jgi:hypothetical protein
MLSAFSLSFPLFALMQKVEQKDQGKHEWLRPFCRPTHSNTLQGLIVYPTDVSFECVNALIHGECAILFVLYNKKR